MAEQRLRVQPRTVLGKRVRQLRRAGILPGVLFGGGDSVPVQTDAHAFGLSYRKWGGTTLITLEGLDGDVPVLVHDVSRDARSGRIVHADFFRVSLTERVHADVPVHFVGESGAVKNLSAVLLHSLDRVRVEAFPQDIPHRIDVDLDALATMDDEIHVRDLAIDAATVRILNDPDDLVIKVVPQRVEEVAPTPAAVEVPAAEGEAPEEAPEAEAEEGEGAQAKKAPAAGPGAGAGAQPPKK